MSKIGIPDLIGEQKRVYELDLAETVLVKGSAGCGKTTVASARARQYLHDYPDLFSGQPHVLFVSYTNSLVDYVSQTMNDPAAPAHMKVSTLHGIAGKLIGTADSRGILKDYEYTRLIHDLPEKPAQYPAEFLKSEFSWIKGMMIVDETNYLAKERRGRGNTPRVTQTDRPPIWKAFEAYQQTLKQRNLKDWDDILIKALALASAPGFTPPFSHIVVDEAQDFSLLALTLISKLIKGRSVTIVADAAQQIYQSGFSWKETGFQVKSHCSITLLRNYRNTRQIGLAAGPLRSNITALEQTPEPEPSAEHCTEGEKPVLHNAAHPQDVLQTLRSMLADPRYQRIIIAEPNRQHIKAMNEILLANGITATPLKTMAHTPAPSILPQNGAAEAKHIYIDTYHAMKGLEFDAVLLDNLSEENLPGKVNGQNDEAVARNRKILYVAMTRARYCLHLFAPTSPSALLQELDPSTLTQQASTSI